MVVAQHRVVSDRYCLCLKSGLVVDCENHSRLNKTLSICNNSFKKCEDQMS